MSMYNLLHGVNPLKDILLKILDIDQPVENSPQFPDKLNSEDFKRYIQECIDRKIYNSGRFRDIYLNGDGTRIILLTRNGGGNRQEYWYIFKIFESHPNYLCDDDDDYDDTYAYIEFSVPEKYQIFTKAMATGEEPKTLFEKFQETISELEKMTTEEIKTDERFKPVVEILEKISDS